jgi:DNA-binding MarR family transcriptional regulator
VSRRDGTPSRPLEGSDPGDLRLVQEVTWRLLAMVERLQQGFAAHAGEFGLSAAQAKLLMQLQPSEELPMRALAERLRYDPSNLTGLVDKLEERGAVRRRPDPRDRRVKALVITEEGVRLRDGFWERVVHDPGPLERLDRAQLRRLQDLLGRALAEEPADRKG